MTREEAIEKLTSIRDEAKEGVSYVTECDVEILDMAIASLKTDEAYQLEYENRNFVEIPEGMTNGEVLQTLFPKCTVRIDSDGWFITTINGCTEFTPEWWNAPYKADMRGEADGK